MKSSRKSNLPDDLKQEIRSYLSEKVREKFDLLKLKSAATYLRMSLRV